MNKLPLYLLFICTALLTNTGYGYFLTNNTKNILTLSYTSFSSIKNPAKGFVKGASKIDPGTKGSVGTWVFSDTDQGRNRVDITVSPKIKFSLSFQKRAATVFKKDYPYTFKFPHAKDWVAWKNLKASDSFFLGEMDGKRLRLTYIRGEAPGELAFTLDLE